MADNSEAPAPSRGRGRGKRGGLGKYLRARGRRGGGGRPAEFSKRLVLEDEETIELEEDSEEVKELTRKYARRQLGTNADRYAEPEPVLNSDGEVEEEPEIDLSELLARQRLEDSLSVEDKDENDGDVDESLAHLGQKSSLPSKDRKGRIQAIEWDEGLEELRKEKEVADANRELKNKFRANVEKQKTRQNRPLAQKGRSSVQKVEEAPPLPGEAPSKPKTEIEEMEDFLDDLLG